MHVHVYMEPWIDFFVYILLNTYLQNGNVCVCMHAYFDIEDSDCEEKV